MAFQRIEWRAVPSLSGHEQTVRHCWNHFGPMFTADIRRKWVSRMRDYSHRNWHFVDRQTYQ